MKSGEIDISGRDRILSDALKICRKYLRIRVYLLKFAKRLNLPGLAKDVIKPSDKSIIQNTTQKCDNIKRSIIFLIFAVAMALTMQAWVKVDDIYYNIENGEANVTYGDDIHDTSRYTGDITIPESIMVGNIPYPVKGIEKYTFSGCKQLTSVILPNSISFIGEYAFSSSGLISIAIPNSIATIGENAFRNCTELMELSIDPYPGLYIGDNAFILCSNLMYVKTTDIVKWCGIRFETITSNPCYDNSGTLYLGVRKITSLEIPEGITEIKNCTFVGCDFTSVTLPSSITSIGDYAFRFCSKLTGITIPNSVKTIGNFAFGYCI